MDNQTKSRLLQDLIEYLDLQDFLDTYPNYTERMVYQLREELTEALMQQTLAETAGKERTFSLYVDGASQPQKKQAGIGGVIFLEDSEIENFSRNIGEATNNVAEYSALLYGLEQLEKYEPEKVYIFADSELVVKQLNGEYQVKNDNMQRLYGQVMNKLRQIPHWTIEHIPRERNRRADQLSKQALLTGKIEGD